MPQIYTDRLCHGFCWFDINNFPDIRTISPTAKLGSAWEVKLKYPDKFHPTHSDYPLCPERRIVKRTELSPHQNNLIDELSGGKFSETEKLVVSKTFFCSNFLKFKCPNNIEMNEMNTNECNWIEVVIDKDYFKYYDYKHFSNVHEIGLGGSGKVFHAKWRNS
ncbi:unnamed protein product [Rhizophagus irregularis]|nr:unnamed protein product [Rhizophagus irregularis]